MAAYAKHRRLLRRNGLYIDLMMDLLKKILSSNLPQLKVNHIQANCKIQFTTEYLEEPKDSKTAK